MATLEECHVAVRRLAKQLGDVDASVRNRYVVERTISCTITDLDTVFRARLTDNGLEDIEVGSDQSAQIRLTANSDDLIALTEGRLAFPSAWASGRIKVDASVLDLLRLRSLI